MITLLLMNMWVFALSLFFVPYDDLEHTHPRISFILDCWANLTIASVVTLPLYWFCIK